MIPILKHNTFLYWTEKGGQRAMKWRDRERGRERERESECCCRWVTAWAINLTFGQIFIPARERIILDLIKWTLRLYTSLDGYYFSLGAVLFHPSVKLLIYKHNKLDRLWARNRDLKGLDLIICHNALEDAFQLSISGEMCHSHILITIRKTVYRINLSLLLKINLQNTWTLQLNN